MKFDQEIYKYLRGEKFSNNLTIEFERKRYESQSREVIITGLVKNRKVIHIGCADHIPLIIEKIAQNKWLHKLITDNTQKCIGIDINKESIDYVKKETGYDNVIYGNILTDKFPVIISEHWDYAVFGEIIEHLDDPVYFLKSFREKFGGSVSKFIITVPNIMNKNVLGNMHNYREAVNSDHRFWFTPYTISKILVSAGFNPENIFFSNLITLNTWQLTVRKIKQLAGIKSEYPFYFYNTLIITGYIQ